LKRRNPARIFKPNQLNYGMVGNVWGWVEDCWYDS
jgi:formylglycine-generating enzyme required for sulfatase activity